MLQAKRMVWRDWLVWALPGSRHTPAPTSSCRRIPWKESIRHLYHTRRKFTNKHNRTRNTKVPPQDRTVIASAENEGERRFWFRKNSTPPPLVKQHFVYRSKTWALNLPAGTPGVSYTPTATKATGVPVLITTRTKLDYADVEFLGTRVTLTLRQTSKLKTHRQISNKREPQKPSNVILGSSNFRPRPLPLPRPLPRPLPPLAGRLDLKVFANLQKKSECNR